ncbi:hypothetical protein [Dethiobacter alkaliphilus]|uniref:Uncharacterized protein n=1 Tax=Dethiobacter alkaliphilus AHT 1 TaxID=555088 RepID=C0GH47_DETAL|nr:hypothetical protein [Dethiobacter alkaliphilus]EEG77349.1 conserved hypothetical protein [Dethiobacter alkaliphilus AHT 1]
MKKTLPAFILVFAIILLLTAKVAEAQKVVVVSLTRTNLERVAADRSMAPWLARGSVGLLNTATAARPAPEHVYVTLGAGSRAMGRESSRLGLNSGEEYAGFSTEEVYRRHLGMAAESRILHLGMAEILRVNKALQHPVQPGLLGDSLREAGKVTAVIGNADTSGPSREAVLFLADSNGQVDLGSVDKGTLQADALFPFGWRMDKQRVWQSFQSLYPQADVLLVDWGDLARLDEYRTLLSDEVVQNLESEIYEDISWFLTRVFVELAADDLLILLLPVPPAGESGAGLLGFMAVMGGPFPPGGELTSATTRRPGLAANTDVAPLILDHLDIPVPGNMLGRTIGYGGPTDVAELLQMQAEIDRIFQLRPPLLRTYVFFQIVIVLGALANIFLGIMPGRWFVAPLLGLLTVPLVLLVLPLYTVSKFWGFVVTILAVVIFVFVLQKTGLSLKHKFAAIAVPTSLLLVLDLLRDAPWIKASVLGYDPVSGARYYGLGNEYMGVLVGATVLGAAVLLTLLSRRRRMVLPALALYLFAVLFLIVSPQGGANFGGTVTALVAFLVTLVIAGRFRPGWRSSLSLLAVLFAVAAAALFVNLRVPQDAQSHLGRTLALMEDDGWQALQDVASRKAAMNITLFRYSQWSRAFLAFLGVLTVLFYRPRGMLRDVHRQYPDLAAGFLGIIAGSITAFLVNDSGVVAAATTLLYAGVPIILLTLDIMDKQVKNTAEHK